MSRSLFVFLAISVAALGCAAPSEPDEASDPVYSRRMNPALHAGHELWLHGMRDRLAR